VSAMRDDQGPGGVARLRRAARRAARRTVDAVVGPVAGSLAGGRTAHAVAVTYDDGPEPTVTPHLLDVLDEHGARCTFFVLVPLAEEHPDLVLDAIARGHEIALHGLDHTPLTDWSHRAAVATLRTARARLEQVTGTPVTRYRPPYGKQTPATWLAARRAGLEVVVWTCDAADWVDATEHEVAQRGLARLSPGGVLLLHERIEPGPRGEPVSTSFDRVTVARLVLAELAARGLEARTVDALVAEAGPRRTAWFGH